MDKWLSNRNVIRIVALVLGILLWVVVHFDNQSSTGKVSAPLSQKIYGVSVTPIYDANQYHVQSIEPSEVQLTLRGKESLLRRVKPGNYRIVLDLNGYTKGTHNLPLKPEGFPSGVDVEIMPQTVKVVLEEMEKKEVPVVIVPVGAPADGYKAGQPIVKPNRVLVTVPSSRIAEVEAVKGEISIDQAKSNVVKQVKLAVFNNKGNEVEGIINPQVVSVEVPVTLPFKTVPLQLKITGELPQGLSIASFKPSTEQVIVYGPQEVLDQMEWYQGPEVNLSELRKDETLKADIPLLPNIVQVEPTKMEVTVKIVPSATKWVQRIPVTIAGGGRDLDAKITVPETGMIDMTVEGAPEMLDRLSPQNVQAVVDVSNLLPGKHQIPILIQLPPFVKASTGQQFRAAVEISGKAGNVDMQNTR